MIPKVIQQRGKGSVKKPSPELVNNFAAAHNRGGEQVATPEPRLGSPCPARARHRSPTPVPAPGPSAERTLPQEGSYIRSHPFRGPGPLSTATKMKTDWTEQTYFVGLDWAKDHHDVVVVDRLGTIVADFQFPHSAEGWNDFQERIQTFGKCPIAIETSNGPAVDQLLQRDYPVYPVNPKAAQRYRERKCPSGNKTDRIDAWSLADALRTDGQGWVQLIAQDEPTMTLRLICRDENVFIEQRTAMVNQLQAALLEYYPLALESFEDWTKPFAWAFIQSFPTPQALRQAGKRRWEKFLHTHKLWRPETAPTRLAAWQKGQQLNASAAVANAKALLALSLVKVLQSLQKQIDEYRQRIRAAFEQHPDHDIFGSLPGAKDKLAPRLLGEVGCQRDVFPDAQSLSCRAGTSPVSFQSGQLRKARIRWACNDFLRHTVHLWADLSRHTCLWAQTYYAAKRKQGHSHASALRCLGKRWLKVLWRMWQDRTAYDESIHLQSLQEHGSFVAKLLAPQPAQSDSSL
jgi:transposase